MLFDKILSWLQSFSSTAYPSYERKKEINAVLKSMDNVVKPEGMNQSFFDDLKYDIAIAYRPEINVLTESVEKIYDLSIFPRSYRETAIKKYLLKLITVSDFRVYLKMAVISDTNPKFNPTMWVSKDYLNLFDALASGDMVFARRFAQEYMRYISLDYVGIYPDLQKL
jgi:hypothetical protein